MILTNSQINSRGLIYLIPVQSFEYLYLSEVETYSESRMIMCTKSSEHLIWSALWNILTSHSAVLTTLQQNFYIHTISKYRKYYCSLFHFFYLIKYINCRTLPILNDLNFFLKVMLELESFFNYLEKFFSANI